MDSTVNQWYINYELDTSWVMLNKRVGESSSKWPYFNIANLRQSLMNNFPVRCPFSHAPNEREVAH